MMGRFSKRTIGACTAVLAVGLLAGGCDWVQFGANTGLNGDNAADTAITRRTCPRSLHCSARRTVRRAR